MAQVFSKSRAGLPLRILNYNLCKILTMLTLYAFFILALSSSVTALQHLAYGEFWLLEGIEDKRLTMGKWTRLKSPLPNGDSNTWTYRQDCDDFIKFAGNAPEIKVFRPRRTLHRGENGRTTYSVPRPGVGDNRVGAQLFTVYPNVPKNKWKDFLDGTFWARVPEITGGDSGPGDNLGPNGASFRADVIGFRWRHERLFVTFYTRTDFTPRFLGPAHWYDLTEEEINGLQDITVREIRGLGNPIIVESPPSVDSLDINDSD